MSALHKLKTIEAIENSGTQSTADSYKIIPDLTRQLYAAPKAKSLGWRYAAADMLALVTGLLAGGALAALINDVIVGRNFMVTSSSDLFAFVTEFVLISAALLAWFQYTGHYHMCMPFWIEAKKIVSAFGLAVLVDGFLQFASKNDLSRLWLISCWVIAAVTMIVLRDLVRRQLLKNERFQKRTLLVGAGETATQTIAALKSERGLNYAITAQIGDLPQALLRAGNSWETLCSMHAVEYIIIALDSPELTACKQQLAQLVRESIPFSISQPIVPLPVMGMVPHYFINHDVTLLARRNELDLSVPCGLKRSFDIIISATALVVLSPLVLPIILLIKKDGGPAFFAHTRLGRNKKPFPCFKFRSMVINGDEILKRHLAENPAARAEWESSQKLLNDPRITRVGDFLRKTSLDELPQLINVLRGEMSLVGPRPIVTAEVPKYDHDIAHYYRVRPGVTGLWQVSGRSDVSYPRRVQMDSWYVTNWSLWHDIAILCKTFPALLNRTGAY